MSESFSSLLLNRLLISNAATIKIRINPI